MLVLSRQRDESIVIGTEETLHVRLSEDERQQLEVLAKSQPNVSELLDKILKSPVGIIEVSLVDIRGDKARLGVDADKNISVHRREVYNDIKKEGRLV